MSICLAAVQHLCAMRGGSQAPSPARLRCTRLGRWLALPMPPVEVIDVSEWLVNYPLTE